MRAGRKRRSALHWRWRRRGSSWNSRGASMGRCVAGLTWCTRAAGAQVRKPLGLIACGVWRLRRLGWPHASLSFRRGAQATPPLRWPNLVNAFAMRCFAALVMLLAVVVGAAEPREDLKPLGDPIVLLLALRGVRLACAHALAMALLQPSIVSSTGAP